jgi:hypothetical protein
MSIDAIGGCGNYDYLKLWPQPKDRYKLLWLRQSLAATHTGMLLLKNIPKNF